MWQSDNRQRRSGTIKMAAGEMGVETFVHEGFRSFAMVGNVVNRSCRHGEDEYLPPISKDHPVKL